MRGSHFDWKVENHLPAAQDHIRDALFAVVSKAVLDIQGGAVSGAPVDTGLLKSGVQAILPDDTYSGPIQGGVGSNTEYAAYVELGTGRAGAGSSYPYQRTARYTMGWAGMAARAFMANAAKRVEPAFVAAVASLQSRLPGRV